jgi:hypothetical protein
MSYLLSRAAEPSSWAGVAAIGAALGMPLAPDLLQPLIQILTGAAALAAVLLRERPRP